MHLDVSTPALLFPAVSLLFLAFTNRFLHLAALVRQLHSDWQQDREPALLAQIDNLRHRLKLIRWMQLLGAGSLLVCVISMVAVMADVQPLAITSFIVALVLMPLSLGALVVEIFVSGGALAILLAEIEKNEER